MNYISKTANGANSKVMNSRGVSRGAGVGGRGNSKILQRSNIISNNNGTPNLNNSKSKAMGIGSGSSQIDNDKYPYQDQLSNGVNDKKDMDAFDKREIGGPTLNGSSKYNKSKSLAASKLPDKPYDNVMPRKSINTNE